MLYLNMASLESTAKFGMKHIAQPEIKSLVLAHVVWSQTVSFVICPFAVQKLTKSNQLQPRGKFVDPGEVFRVMGCCLATPMRYLK